MTTEKTISDDNKLIAEFMGMYKEVNNLILPLGNDEYYIDLSDEDTFKFNTSWDWLMPVVEKMESLGYGFEILGNRCRIEAVVTTTNINKISSVYLSVVAFIEWYNAAKKDLKTNKRETVMKTIKNLTGNDISELQSLTYKLQNEIEKYSHVSEYLPKALTKSLTEYREKLSNEAERREEIYYGRLGILK